MNVEVYPHLNMALEWLDDSLPRTAVDVGCGAGRDAMFLIEQGFTVHAFDNNDEAIARLRALAKQHLKVSLLPQVSSFEQYDYPDAALITACSSLFFCHPDLFPAVWAKVTQSLLSGGIFCGHFMGPNDSWARMGWGDLSVHTHTQLTALFEQDYRVLDIYEHEADGATLLGREKHWHTYSVLAQKVT